MLEITDMPLILIGLFFGLAIGAGIYFLLIRPALKERTETQAPKEKRDQQ